jgi:hypothetical protein
MYTDKKAPKEVRSQAQSLLVFFTQGVGMFFGYRIAAGQPLFSFISDFFSAAISALPFVSERTIYIPFISDYRLTPGFTAVQESSNALAATIETPTFSFWESFGKMFLSEKPNATGSIVSDAMVNWKTFWMFPSLMAIVVVVIFAVAFWDKVKDEKASTE